MSYSVTTPRQGREALGAMGVMPVGLASAGRAHCAHRWLVAGLLALGLMPWVPAPAVALERLSLSTEQITRLGIELAPPEVLSGDQGGPAALAARVIVPPQQLHMVSAPLAGLVTQVVVAPGQSVRRGQALLHLAGPALSELRRGASQAAIHHRQADQVARRDRHLFEEGLIAEARLKASEAARDEARLALAEREAALRWAGAAPGEPSALDEIVVRAPTDGMMLELSVSPGSRVDTGAPMAKVGRIDRLWLEVELPIRDAQGLTAHAPLSVDGVARRARSIGISPDVSAGSQTVLLRAEVLPVAGAAPLRPGQAVSVDIGTLAGAQPKAANARAQGSAPRQWRVPTAAIARIDDKPVVFARAPDGFRIVAVELRRAGAAEAVVAGPLQVDDRIAVAGAASLKAVALGLGAR